MSNVGRRGLEPDPRTASTQAEFRRRLKELMRWAGYTSLQQLEMGADRRSVSMPASTAHRAVTTDRLPTADFVRRFVIACAGDVGRWTAARDVLADRDYARCPPEVDPAPSSPQPSSERNGAVVDICPYPGLAAFGTDQAKWFFGRKRATAEVVSRLTERLAGTGPLIVLGPSGAGKFSLLRAGLVSALGEGRLPESRNWLCLLFTPGADPIRELATRVAELAGTETGAVIEELVADPARLVDILRSVPVVVPEGQQPEMARVVLVVDQFEETFTLCADEQRRRLFIRALCAASTCADGRPPVALAVLGLRADFYGHCAVHPELVDALRHGQMLLGAMDAAELRDAIEKPAHAVGLAVQPGLVEVMLADLGAEDSAVADGVRYEPGALPLLSHSLLATWQQRDGAQLTLEGYRLIGGIRGAIAITAEQAYQQLDPGGQRIARQLLLRMIMLGEGVEGTRRKLDRAQLAGEAADVAVAEAVLDVLARARLVTLHAATVEIAHEAVLRAWPRLREWIATDRAGLLIQQRLVEAAETWDREDRHPSGLYQGPRLAAVQDWVDTARPDLTPLARAFLAVSVQREHNEQHATRRRARRLRQLIAGLGVLLLLTATATGYAVHARNDAVQGRNEGISRKVAGEAIALRASNPALAAQLSLAAFRLEPTAEARGALISTVVNLDTTRVFQAKTGDAVRSAAFSPDGHILAAGSQDTFAYLWNVAESPNLGEPMAKLQHAKQVRSVAFSPDGLILATAGRDMTAKLWDITNPRTPAELSVLDRHTGSVFCVAFSRDGNTLATASEDRTAKLWDITDRRHPVDLATLIGHDHHVNSVAFSHDGNIVATASLDGKARLWDITNLGAPIKLATLTRNTDFVNSVAFSPIGNTLATANHDLTARLWDISNPRDPIEVAVLTGQPGPVTGVTFSPDGHTLATTSLDTTVRLWNVTAPAHPTALAAPLVGHTDNVYSVAFSRDGHTAASTSHDTTVRLWETDVDHRIPARICEIARPAITRAEWDHYFPGLDYEPPCP